MSLMCLGLGALWPLPLGLHTSWNHFVRLPLDVQPQLTQKSVWPHRFSRYDLWLLCQGSPTLTWMAR